MTAVSDTTPDELRDARETTAFGDGFADAYYSRPCLSTTGHYWDGYQQGMDRGGYVTTEQQEVTA